eukprot:scaffold18987_cov109-Isochrysis_galbana.AAC.10
MRTLNRVLGEEGGGTKRCTPSVLTSSSSPYVLAPPPSPGASARPVCESASSLNASSSSTHLSSECERCRYARTVQFVPRARKLESSTLLRPASACQPSVSSSQVERAYKRLPSGRGTVKEWPSTRTPMSITDVRPATDRGALGWGWAMVRRAEHVRWLEACRAGGHRCCV